MKVYLKTTDDLQFKRVDFKDGDIIKIIYNGSNMEDVESKVYFDENKNPYYIEPNMDWHIIQRHIYRDGKNISHKFTDDGILENLIEKLKYNFENDIDVELSELEKEIINEDTLDTIWFILYQVMLYKDKETTKKIRTNLIKFKELVTKN